MNCQIVQQLLSAHLDGWLTEEERRHVLLHLARCQECAITAAQLRRTRAAVRALPIRTPPAELTSVLRVMASREWARRRLRTNPKALLAYMHDRLRLWADNLMRPVALPLAGGLVSAVLLFAMLVPSIVFRPNLANDIPIIGLYWGVCREATVTASPLFSSIDDDFVLEVMVDEQGRMMDYTVTEGAPSFARNVELRRSIENKLLFTEFAPSLMFGQPTSSRIYVPFQKRRINVGS